MKAFFILQENTDIKSNIINDYFYLVFECTSNYNAADIIISDLHSLATALKLKEHYGLPVVLVFFKSMQDKLFDVDTLCVDLLICVRDTSLAYNVPQLYPYNEILFPIQIREADNEQSLKKKNILVSLSDSLINDIQLYNIIRLLNRMTQFNITILHRDHNIESICNSHISVTNRFNLIEDLVKSNYLVIGSGIAAVLALMHQKQLIIIGDTGYGGIPTFDNLPNHRNNYFQGAIGMALGAPVPSFLLHEDIEKISNREINSMFTEKALHEYLEIDKEHIRNRVLTLINNQESSDYKLNPALDYRSIGNGTIILQRFTNQILAELDKDCATALKWIVEGQNIDTIDRAAIQLLIKNNIVVSK